AREVANYIRSLGHEVLEVERPDGETATTVIRDFKPDIVWHVGHGAVCVTALEYDDPWLTKKSNSYELCTEDRFLDIVAGRIFDALSCFTGVELGKEVVNRGAKAYLGYIKEFWFLLCNDIPCPCGRGKTDPVLIRALKATQLCNLEFLKSLAEGKSIDEAFEASLSRFDEEIKYFENSTHRIAPIAIKCLRLDKNHQVLYKRV
ncbi:MAG: hypothetical protein ACXQTS_07770, partial [Candidatus Methanospirareceae archaeon]